MGQFSLDLEKKIHKWLLPIYILDEIQVRNAEGKRCWASDVRANVLKDHGLPVLHFSTVQLFINEMIVQGLLRHEGKHVFITALGRSKKAIWKKQAMQLIAGLTNK